MSDDKTPPTPTDPDEIGGSSAAEAHQAENAKNDEEVAAISRTIKPHSDAPSRSGIVGAGSGADGEGL